MTNEEALEILDTIPTIGEQVDALEMAIKALEQQLRDCKTCKHSDNGNCAGSEECHECMWESKYEQQPSEPRTNLAETSQDCISREAVLEGLANIAKAKAKSDAQKSMMGRCMFFVEHLPSVTPERPKGKWLARGVGFTPYECSECEAVEFKKSNYCPNCGVKMSGCGVKMSGGGE